MKAEVKVTYSSNFEIDLEDYGHDPETRYEDLSVEQKNEICDHIREDAIPFVDVNTIDN